MKGVKTMFKIAKKIITKLFLFTIIIILTVISNVYKIIFDFITKHKLNFENFHIFLVRIILMFRRFYTQVN